MIALVLAALLVVVGLAVALALGKLSFLGADAPTRTAPFEELPARGPVHPEDLEDLRFDQVLRGYRMVQVDRALERLREELAERDTEIRRLRAERDAVARSGDEHDVSPWTR